MFVLYVVLFVSLPLKPRLENLLFLICGGLVYFSTASERPMGLLDSGRYSLWRPPIVTLHTTVVYIQALTIQTKYADSVTAVEDTYGRCMHVEYWQLK